ncbi:MAG: molybdopterin-dependent oxidoreductase, partial [Phycisphaerae bacterium]
IAERFAAIRAAHGPDSVGLYISGQCLTEEYYLANKLAKGFLQTNNIDTNSRLCMSSAVCGYKQTLGADGPPVSYADIEQADTFFIVGANPAWCHPILFRRLEARRAADPDVRIVVVDPRRTPSAAVADLHLALRPGTDVALFFGLARELWHRGHADTRFLAEHTENADEFLASLAPWTLQRTAAVCGLNAADIAQAAEWLGGPRRFLSMWTMGLNQSAVGTDKNIALIQLSLLTGKIGKPGCGPFSLTGQPNAMGGREVGGMATLLSAHRDLRNPEHRAQVAQHWGVADVPANPGLTAVEMFDALRQGKMKALWIIATNPVASLPNAWRVEEALQQAEFVVAQDIYPTETTDLADVVLPAAGWLEKCGTMTNSDRRVALLEKAIDPPGVALPDADILIRVAQAMGWGAAFNYANSAAVFAEHAALTAGTDIDITGLSHARLRAQGPLQWPCPAADHPGTPRLYTSGRFPTASGRAKFHVLNFTDRSEPTSPEFPLVLTTGRIRDQWHTMTKSGLVGKLRQHIDTPFCEMHPDDATTRGLAAGDIAVVQSARGQVQVVVRITTDSRPGVIFLPMHWGKKLGGPRGRANNLTSPRLDPVSKEPDLKYCAAEVVRFAPPRRRIVIIGAGAAAWGFIEAHRRYNADDSIVLLGAEPCPIYNRVLLPHYIERVRSRESLVRADDDALRRQDVTFHPGTAVTAIDRVHRDVVDEHGTHHPYDVLLIATGSRPAIHYDGPLPAEGVYTLRSRADAEQIMAAVLGKDGATNIVINGGGLLGLELADALKQLEGTRRVTIVQRSDRLMGKQLDAPAAALLAEEIRDRGVEIRFNTLVTSMSSGPAVDHLILDTLEGIRTTMPCDMLIFATGIVPNKELAGAAGLDCDCGIIVNQYLQTSDPAIFALGECAQVGEQTFGTTPAAVAQARALAEYLRGNLHAGYRGTVTSNILKIHNLALASAGQIDPPDPTEVEEIIVSDPKRRFYQKCVVQDDRLIGIIMLGDTQGFTDYLDLIARRTELEERRFGLLRPGRAGGGGQLDGPLVCSCNQVGRGTIVQIVKTQGGDLGRVCDLSRAGTSCGSCRPEVLGIIEEVLPTTGRITPPTDASSHSTVLSSSSSA